MWKLFSASGIASPRQTELRWRLLLAFALVVLVTIISLGFGLREGAIKAVDRFAQRGGFIGADPMVSLLETYYQQNGSWDDVEDVFSVLSPVEEGDHTMIIPGGGQGNQGAQRGQGQGQGQGQGMMGGPGAMMEPAPISMSLLDADGAVLIGNEELAGITQLDEIQLQYAIPIRVDNEIVGYLLPRGGGFRQDLDFQKRLSSLLSDAIIRASLIAGGLSLALALVLGYMLVKPIRTLTNAANKLAEGNLNNRVEVSGSKELVTLGETFNHMAASLQEAEQRRQAMTADIAHELRTPLAVQRANLEAMMDGIYPLNDENMAQILAQNTMLTRLVEDLRLLALSDANELQLYKETTDLASFTEHTAEQFRSQAIQQDIDLLIDIPQGLPGVEMDPHRIGQVLNNLLSNALRHSPQSGKVEVVVEQNGKQIDVRIHDSGTGIPEAALPHIFERFYRSDQARARDHGGSGLGLTIARKLVEAHGGSLTARNHPNGGAEFIITLPVAA